jgi:transcriptional regulator with XRE-family HTH domain
LRCYRQQLDLTLQDAATVLECDRSKISRVESGQRGIRPKELRELLTEYGVPDAEQQPLLRLADRKSRPAWLGNYASTLPKQVADYYGLEPAASEILIYDGHTVPSLLQTPEYARVIAETGLERASGEQAEHRDALGELRKELLLDGSLQVSVVMGEAAVWQRGGLAEVMAGQVNYLAEVSGVNPAVTVQVLPFTARPLTVAGSASFTLLRFGAVNGLEVAFVSTLGGGVFVEEQREVAAYMCAFAQLREDALSADDTIRLLREASAPSQ